MARVEDMEKAYTVSATGSEGPPADGTGRYLNSDAHFALQGRMYENVGLHRPSEHDRV